MRVALRLRILGNQESPEKSQNVTELQPSSHASPRIKMLWIPVKQKTAEKYKLKRAIQV